MFLIIEDDNTVAEFVGMVADDYCDAYDHAKNLEEVKHFLLSGKKYQLIVTDLSLGPDSGIDVIKLVKGHKDKYYHQVPIIVISGLFDKDFVEKYKDKLGLLEKPFQLGELKSLIEKTLSKRIRPKKEEKIENLKKSNFLKKLTKG